MPSWDFYNKLGPGRLREGPRGARRLRLQRRGRQALPARPGLLRPLEVRRAKPLTFPDRIRLTLEAVRAGKGLMLLGGWYSFTGEHGQGWLGPDAARRSPAREVPGDGGPRREHRGLLPGRHARGPGVLRGPRRRGRCPRSSATTRRDDDDEGTVLLEVAQTGDPLLAVRAFGKGRVLAFTSDPAPHWGLNFVYWDGYGEFWRRCLDDVLRQGGGRSPRPAMRPRRAASARR